ncbi:hypothetical protein F2Q65_01195 [Thiohalocapsa marina]|uniref:Uncharacterized protein n=1 Tax=Thiohalocapsa marina TaxID=424902 RepID=A0A5M8FVM1_9GAMM|nr:hypothetical protein [Thiohalocapsa marina]KAA6187881.1 hypothetical protein F2Q65_01195 [Thiohalocapsa marina]
MNTRSQQIVRQVSTNLRRAPSVRWTAAAWAILAFALFSLPTAALAVSAPQSVTPDAGITATVTADPLELVGHWGSGHYLDIVVQGQYAYAAAGTTRPKILIEPS